MIITLITLLHPSASHWPFVFTISRMYNYSFKSRAKTYEFAAAVTKQHVDRGAGFFLRRGKIALGARERKLCLFSHRSSIHSVQTEEEKNV